MCGSTRPLFQSLWWQTVLVERILAVPDGWQHVVELGSRLGADLLDVAWLLLLLIGQGLQWSLLIAWLAWWLLAVNWKKLWPVLAQGAWVPCALLVVVAALAWSRLAPADNSVLGVANVANYWWQLGAVTLLAGLTLFCAWLQGALHLAPTDIPLEPQAPSALSHGHDH
jgi:hypothetical protein